MPEVWKPEHPAPAFLFFGVLHACGVPRGTAMAVELAQKSLNTPERWSSAMLTTSNPSQMSAPVAGGFAHSSVMLAVRNVEAAAGDVFMFTREGACTEIVIGFRPGLDKLVFARSERLCLRQDGGNAVIVRACGSLVMLEGVGAEALTRSDIAFDYVQ